MPKIMEQKRKVSSLIASELRVRVPSFPYHSLKFDILLGRKNEGVKIMSIKKRSEESSEEEKKYFLNDCIKTNVKKYKKWKAHHRYTFYFWEYIAIIGLVIIIACQLAKHPNWQIFLFVTDNGRFQWLGLSAAAAGIGLLINAIDNRRKFRADLISKSRIAWIPDTKKLLSEFLTLSASCMVQRATTKEHQLQYELDVNNVEKYQQCEEQINKYNDINNKLQITRRALLMTFSEASDNEELVLKITAIDDTRSDFITLVDNIKKFDELENFKSMGGYKVQTNTIQTLIDEIIPMARDYFKTEWEKAKSGN